MGVFSHKMGITESNSFTGLLQKLSATLGAIHQACGKRQLFSNLDKGHGARREGSRGIPEMYRIYTLWVQMSRPHRQLPSSSGVHSLATAHFPSVRNLVPTPGSRTLHGSLYHSCLTLRGSLGMGTMGFWTQQRCGDP